MTWNSSQYNQVWNAVFNTKVNLPTPESNEELSLEEFLEEDFKIRGELYEIVVQELGIVDKLPIPDDLADIVTNSTTITLPRIKRLTTANSATQNERGDVG